MRGAVYRSLNPATGELLEEFPPVDDGAVEQVARGAAAAHRSWRRLSVDARGRHLVELASALDRHAAELARLAALEMGKPLAEGEAEVAKCAWVCRHAAEQAPHWLAAQPRPSDAGESYVRLDPLGPVLAIMPWNFPYWQLFRFAAPALAAGNVVIFKPAPSTPRSALRLGEVLADGGLPPGVVQSLLADLDQVGRLIEDSRVRAVTLTGSSRAGREVAARAGASLKPIVLELGGSDPFIVLEDADVEEAARTAVIARCLNAGQSCIAAKRFLVHECHQQAFRQRLVSGMQARVMGDPLDPRVDLGPLARADLREVLEGQVRRSVAAGARVECGGAPADGPGFFYLPTVLSDVSADAPAWTEELFGPVAAVVPFRDEAEAIALANGSEYGLGASVWTADAERGKRLAAELEVGTVAVNGMVKSDPRLPFGGVKASGFGRELGREGMLEFVNVKTVWVR